MIGLVFTGIVEAAAEVAALDPSSGGARLVLRHVPFAAGLTQGESVAVNGCCLTVTATEPDRDGGTVEFDLLAETLRVTNLGRLSRGSRVNLERALRAGDRLSGHYVQGHIDTVAEVLDYSPHGQDHRLEITLPREYAAQRHPPRLDRHRRHQPDRSHARPRQRGLLDHPPHCGRHKSAHPAAGRPGQRGIRRDRKIRRPLAGWRASWVASTGMIHSPASLRRSDST